MGNAKSRNFHLPLPAALYDELREEARRRATPATAVAREAIEACLRDRRKAELREAIAAYAARYAGSRADLDRDLESAALEFLGGRGRSEKK